MWRRQPNAVKSRSPKSKSPPNQHHAKPTLETFLVHHSILESITTTPRRRQLALTLPLRIILQNPQHVRIRRLPALPINPPLLLLLLHHPPPHLPHLARQRQPRLLQLPPDIALAGRNLRLPPHLGEDPVDFLREARGRVEDVVGGGVREDRAGRVVFLPARDEEEARGFEAVEVVVAVRPAVFEVLHADPGGAARRQRAEVIFQLLGVGDGDERPVLETLLARRVEGVGFGEVFGVLVFRERVLDERDVLLRVGGEGEVADDVLEGRDLGVFVFEVFLRREELRHEFAAGALGG